MYKHLYDKFKDWYHGGSIWLYSDPHFADEEMKYLRANYIGDDEQVKRINSKVGKNDTLIILGDVGNIEFVKKLRGYKILIMGNHDAGASNYKRKKILINNGCQCPVCNNNVVFLNTDNDDAWCNACRKWVIPAEVKYSDNYLFDEVYEGPLFISDKILLSHEPIEFPYVLNIHGHDHSKWHQEDDMHYNVCAEHIDYTPVNLKWIVESGCLKRIPSIHRVTIDRATEKKEKRKNN